MLLYFAICHKPLLGRGFVGKVAVILRYSNIISNFQFMSFMIYVLLDLILFLQFATYAEKPKWKLILKEINCHILKCLSEVCFVLGHEVLHLAVHLTSEELDSEDYLVPVQLFDEAVVEVGRVFLLSWTAA